MSRKMRISELYTREYNLDLASNANSCTCSHSELYKKSDLVQTIQQSKTNLNNVHFSKFAIPIVINQKKNQFKKSIKKKRTV